MLVTNERIAPPSTQNFSGPGGVGLLSHFRRNCSAMYPFSDVQMAESGISPSSVGPKVWMAAGLARRMAPELLTRSTGHAAFPRVRATSDFIKRSRIAGYNLSDVSQSNLQRIA